MKYTIFCSGSKGNSTLIETATTRVLIDCGHTKRHLIGAFAQAQVKVEFIDAVVLTHDHIDHVSQLKLFEARPVYSPVTLNQRPDAIPVIPGQAFQVGDITLLPIGLSHDAERTVGYVLTDGQERVVYVTDTGYVREADFDPMRNATHYIFESNHDVELLMATSRPYPIKSRILSANGHLSNQDSARVLAQLVGPQTQSIILAHLSLEANTERHALTTLVETFEACDVSVSPSVHVQCARQYESVTGGCL
jgi:phosphoribosyl 1,2-cyclic phosphodiesterase